MAKVINMSEALLMLSEGIKDNALLPNIKKYEPHYKQGVFHCSYKKKKLYIGGNRSGKTVAGVCEGIWRATCRHPFRPDLNEIGPNRGRVVAVDFTQGIDKIIIPIYQQWTVPSQLRGGSWDSAYDKGSRTLHFRNGSTIEFMSYDQDLDKFAGTSRHWIHLDEEPPKSIFNECLARLIDTDGDYWISMTPVEGMTWIYDDLYEPNVDNADGNVLVVEISTHENPYLKESAIETFLDSIDSDEASTRVDGKFVQQGGRVWKNFDPTVGGPHVLKEPIDNPALMFKDWLWIMCLDHGLNNPTAVLWIAIDENGFGVVFDEHYLRGATIDQHAAHIKLKIKKHGRMADLLVADPSIFNRTAITGTSIQQEYQKYGLSFTPGKNEVKAGLIRVKRYFNQTPYVGRRNHPLFVDANDESKATFPRLRISPVCVNLIYEAKRYRWKTYTNKKLQYENNAYDEPHKKDDHACDALRYGLMSQPDLFADNGALEGQGFRNRVDDALDNMGVSRDGGFNPKGTASDDDVADPFDMGLQAGDSVPSRVGNNGGWSYDEHLGFDF